MIRLVERLIFPLFFVTVVLGLAYWYWTTTPTYALSQIVGAVRNRDTETFEKYVDVESIAYRAIDDVLHGPAREAGMFGKFDNMIGVGIIGLFKPEIAEIARNQVLKFIESGALLGDAKKHKKTANPVSQASSSAAQNPVSSSEPTENNEAESSETSLPGGFGNSSTVARYAKKLKINKQLKAYGLSKEGFKGIDYLKTEGQTALVGFKFHSDKFNRDIIIEIKMEDAGGYWRVTELSNLNDLINTYLETRDQLSSFGSTETVIRISGNQLFLLSSNS